MATSPQMQPEDHDASDVGAASEAAADPKAQKKAQRQAAREQKRIAREAMGGNKPWFMPTMLGLMIFGLVWVVLFYLSAGQFPIASIGNWNLGIGFAFIMAGFLMTTQWK